MMVFLYIKYSKKANINLIEVFPKFILIKYFKNLAEHEYGNKKAEKRIRSELEPQHW